VLSEVSEMSDGKVTAVTPSRFSWVPQESVKLPAARRIPQSKKGVPGVVGCAPTAAPQTPQRRSPNRSFLERERQRHTNEIAVEPMPSVVAGVVEIRRTPHLLATLNHPPLVVRKMAPLPPTTVPAFASVNDTP
jgi:hypothetical protein